MNEYATRYACRVCGTHKWLFERPLSCARSVRTGCESCARICRHKAVGVP